MDFVNFDRVSTALEMIFVMLCNMLLVPALYALPVFPMLVDLDMSVQVFERWLKILRLTSNGMASSMIVLPVFRLR
jgi:hypothetical protein